MLQLFLPRRPGSIRAEVVCVINDKDIQPVVCPAGMRNDRRRHYNMPCPSDDSLEEEFRWREEHIQ